MQTVEFFCLLSCRLWCDLFNAWKPTNQPTNLVTAEIYADINLLKDENYLKHKINDTYVPPGSAARDPEDAPDHEDPKKLNSTALAFMKSKKKFVKTTEDGV